MINARRHGVGFFVSPSLRPHLSNFLAHSPRICEVTVHTNLHPLTVFSIYASSTVEDSTEDVARKEFFLSQLGAILAEHPNSHVIVLGDYNSRLDEYLDPDQDHIGPHVWGRRQSIEDPRKGQCVVLIRFLAVTCTIASPDLRRCALLAQGVVQGDDDQHRLSRRLRCHGLDYPRLCFYLPPYFSRFYF